MLEKAGSGAERRAMKASKFTDAQKAFILKQAEEGVPVGDGREAGISQSTFYSWRKKCAWMTPPEIGE